MLYDCVMALFSSFFFSFLVRWWYSFCYRQAPFLHARCKVRIKQFDVVQDNEISSASGRLYHNQ